jgi:hypothetical protein
MTQTLLQVKRGFLVSTFQAWSASTAAICVAKRHFSEKLRLNITLSFFLAVFSTCFPGKGTSLFACWPLAREFVLHGRSPHDGVCCVCK